MMPENTKAALESLAAAAVRASAHRASVEIRLTKLEDDLLRQEERRRGIKRRGEVVR